MDDETARLLTWIVLWGLVILLTLIICFEVVI